MGITSRVLVGGYRYLIRPVLFRIGDSPEVPHELMLKFLGRAAPGPRIRSLAMRFMRLPSAPVEIAGIRFPGRVGLAAGADKDGRAIGTWACLGFGFAELGTVTPEPQPGNDAPRLFRLPASRAIINRMGFNNDGADVLANRLRAAGVRPGNRAAGIPIGVSLGKQKSTPLADAAKDYEVGAAALADYCDYFVINVSSPNTPGLRELQAAEFTLEAIERISQVAPGIPVFVKLTCDMASDALAPVVAACEKAGAAGLVASNTTVARYGLAPVDASLADEGGGLSGAPLTMSARQLVSRLRSLTSLPIIGVGGIMSADDAEAMLASGADLIQVYTGFIYSGVGLVRSINERISQ